ncbi:MAG TPA: PLP-dependent aminotransferase family protein [Spirochaetales bacterium]|nr:PLP-dependent aminotransferase family protein [Spirochaetales bacterium]HRY54408.1 PLP-dependent aminotransferase family protein [Spirochaetia bacterium]HRZ64448.1 PLP-dependent aminotransferase family protein [Spirochaetia bacterium]
MDTRFARRMGCMQPSSIGEILRAAENPQIISFAGGLPAAELFPVAEVAAAVQRTLAEIGPRALQYGVTEGIKPLREWIAAEMGLRGAACGADEVLVTTGSQQSLDLLGKIFLDPGDLIITENPTYLAAIQAFQAYEARFLAADTDEDGIIPESVEELAGKHEARFLYVIPNFQNPTGRTLSAARRKALYEVAARRGLIVVEDDPYGKLRYRGEHIAPLKSLDREGLVIYLSTFSKIVAPGFRTGWMVASKAVRERIVAAKAAADLHTSSLDQLVLERYLRDYDNAKHVEKVRSAYGERYGIMDGELAKAMPEGYRWTRPDGGMFLWVTGPEGLDSLELLKSALARQIVFVPGRDFFPDGSGAECMRLNFSNSKPELIREGVKRLAALCSDLP